jgi:hypothetical protein
MMFSG